MEDLIDYEYLLGPIEAPVESPRMLRFEIRSRRDAEFDQEQQEMHYKLHGPEFGPEFGDQKAPESPNWAGFVRECEKHLAKRVKDLWVCAWYCEALLIRDGFRGLAEGFDLTKRMIEQHWDVIEPSPNDEDGPAGTVKMFAGLSKGSSFTDRLLRTPISESSGETSPLTSGTMEDVDEGTKQALMASTSDEFKQELVVGIRRCLESFEALGQAFQEKCGDDAPPTAKLKELFERCEKEILEIYPSAVATPGETAEAANEVLVQDGAQNGSGGFTNSGSHVQNREEAFRLLDHVAAFFRDNEPSSPVSYALNQAVRWGRMSLPELIEDLVDQKDVRKQIMKVTGIPRSDGESDD